MSRTSQGDPNQHCMPRSVRTEPNFVAKIRSVELFCGFGTAFFALVVPQNFSLLASLFEDRAVKEVLIGIASTFLFLIGPAFLIAAGAYLHAKRRSTNGVPMIVCGSMVLTVLGVILALVGWLYTQPTWFVVLMFAPSVMALMTLIAVVLSRVQSIVYE
jgi:small-conductance mechanosensitive channel